MSFDICVFHSSAAPHQPIEFEKWYRQITEWDIYQEYDDVSVCQSDLQEWYKSMIKRFPVMNGRNQESSAQAFLAAHPEVNGDEAEMLLENSMADYSLSQNLIYAAFNWDLASEVYMMARDEAFRLGLGFYDLSNNRVYFSSSDIMLMSPKIKSESYRLLDYNEGDDFGSSYVINVGFFESPYRYEYQWTLSFVFKYEAKEEGAFPDEEEDNFLGLLEYRLWYTVMDQLGVDENQICRLCYRTITNGKRIYMWRVLSEELCKKCVELAKSGESMFEGRFVDISFEEDRDLNKIGYLYDMGKYAKESWKELNKAQTTNVLYGIERFAFKNKWQIYGLVLYFIIFSIFVGISYYKLPDKDLSMNDWNFASYFGFAIFLVLYFYPIVAFIIGMMGSCRIKHRTGRFFRGK